MLSLKNLIIYHLFVIVVFSVYSLILSLALSTCSLSLFLNLSVAIFRFIHESHNEILLSNLRIFYRSSIKLILRYKIKNVPYCCNYYLPHTFVYKHIFKIKYKTCNHQVYHQFRHSLLDILK